MTVQINGTSKNLPDNCTVSMYVEQEGYQLSRIAIEINGAIVPKAKYHETLIHSGDVIEVVSFVGGG